MNPSSPVETVTKIFYYLDERRYDDILQLFMEDGQWRRKEKWRFGRADILASLNERPSTQIIRHVITNAHVEKQDDRSASVIAYMISYTFDDGKLHQSEVALNGPSNLYTMASELVLSDGQWKISSQDSTVIFTFNR
jgi:hypothetical protein